MRADRKEVCVLVFIFKTKKYLMLVCLEIILNTFSPVNQKFCW